MLPSYHHHYNLIQIAVLNNNVRIIFSVILFLICKAGIPVILTAFSDNIGFIQFRKLLSIHFDKSIFIQKHICILMKDDPALVNHVNIIT